VRKGRPLGTQQLQFDVGEHQGDFEGLANTHSAGLIVTVEGEQLRSPSGSAPSLLPGTGGKGGRGPGEGAWSPKELTTPTGPSLASTTFAGVPCSRQESSRAFTDVCSGSSAVFANPSASGFRSSYGRVVHNASSFRIAMLLKRLSKYLPLQLSSLFFPVRHPSQRFLQTLQEPAQRVQPLTSFHNLLRISRSSNETRPTHL